MAPWEARLGSFGWDVAVVDGHDRGGARRRRSRAMTGRPVAVVADIPEGEW